ncbi:hypothetical protein J6590_083176 [Homalodisca vitripennis]|nr:hypothetical protein J6590_083176 [Homalodisca vitripennis]
MCFAFKPPTVILLESCLFPAFLYKQVCVLSIDSGDSKLGSTLHSAVSRYSAVSALQCCYHIQFWLKEPLQPTLTVVDAASTYSVRFSAIIFSTSSGTLLYKQVSVLSSDSGDSNLESTLHSAVSRYSAVSALHCGHHIQFCLKQPLQPTLTVEDTASTYSVRFSAIILSASSGTSLCAVYRLRGFKTRIHPTFRSLQVFSRVRVTVWLPHPVLFEGTSPAHTNGRRRC